MMPTRGANWAGSASPTLPSAPYMNCESQRTPRLIVTLSRKFHESWTNAPTIVEADDAVCRSWMTGVSGPVKKP
jgi:hypothetical protein